MAADVITRFKLETTQYDSALRNATKALKDVVHQTELAGKDFKEFSDKAIEAARALGQQATGASNAKDKVKELVSSYNEMAKTYNLMSEAMKKSEGGKALSASLQQLQQRIKEAKTEMNATPGILDTLASKFVVSFDAMKMFNVGLQAVEGTLKVAKDAFFASEQNVDEWGRIMASSQSLYEGFVTSLNNSDFTGFITRIDDIVKAAREAYNELDRLGTMRTIQAPQTERQNSENVRMRTMLMTGRYIAPSDGRAPIPGMKTGDLLSPAQIKTLERQLQGGMNTIIKLTQNELDQTGRAIEAYYNKLAVQNGMTLEEFKKGTSSMAEFDQRQEGYRKYQQWRQENSFTDMYGNRQVREGNPYQEFKKWGTFRVDKMGENSFNDLVGLIRQQQQQQSQIYSSIGQTYRTINRAEGITVKGIINGGSGGRGGGKGGSVGLGGEKDEFQEMEELIGLINIQHQKLQDLQNLKPFAQTEEELISLNQQIKETNDEYQRLLNLGNEPVEDPFTPVLPPLMQLDSILKELNEELNNAETPEVYQDILSDIKSINQEIDKFKGVNTAQKTSEGWKDAAQAISSVGAALQSIEDPGAKIVGIVGQAIANIALGFAQATATSGAVGGIFGWIAAIAGGLATMTSTIAAIHSATGYAEGGIVKGNTYSSDQIYAGLNAQEVVLNRAQAGNLASQLQEIDNGGGGVDVARISGEQVYIILNRYLKRSGRGEIATMGTKE